GMPIVASELLGRAGTGGAGTADSLLAVALGRHGHQVELLVASGRDIGPLSPEWTRSYESAGVNIRVVEHNPGVRPPYLAAPFEIFEVLHENPPDVVVVDDWRGLGYAALRARQAGRALTETAFVVYCHGPGRVLSAFAEKVPDTLERFGEQIAERTSLALADVVVSPSRWLLEWMRHHAWPVPESARVIQYLRESTALGEPRRGTADGGGIRRLAFFGQLREGKGIRIFLAGVNQLESDHARVLCRPTADDLAAALARALTNPHFTPARPARDGREAFDAWLELVDTVRPSLAAGVRPATHVAVVAGDEASESRAHRLA